MKKTSKITRKIAAALLSAAILTSVVAGCGTKSTPATESSSTSTATAAASTAPAKPATWVSDKPLEVSMLYVDNSGFTYKKDWKVFNDIKELTNVDLEVQVVPQADYVTKVKLLLGSGSAPDIITHAGASDYRSFMQSGAVLSISDNMDSFPNYKKAMDSFKYDMEFANSKMNDGKSYELLGVNEEAQQTAGLDIRIDLLKEFNMEIPKTFEDFYQYLKKCKEKYPDSTPLTEIWKADMLYYGLSPSWGAYAGWSFTGHGFGFDPDTNAAIYPATSDNTKEMLRYLNKLYKEGLFDPEIFSQSDDAWKKKLASNKAFATWDWIGQTDEIVTAAKDAGNTIEFQMIPPLTASIAKPRSPGTGRPGLSWIIPSSVAEKENFKDILKFIDIFRYSEEMQTYLYWGIENEDYNIVDGSPVRIDKYNRKKTVDADIRKDSGFANQEFLGFKPKEWMYADLNAREEVYVKSLVDNNMVFYGSPYRDFLDVVDQVKADRAKQITTPLKDYTENMKIQFIIGKKDIDKDWDAYKTEADKKGAKELMVMLQEAGEKEKARLGK